MSKVSQQFPLPWWAVALILLGGTGTIGAIGGATGTRMAEVPSHAHETITEDITDLTREVSDVESLVIAHERRFQAVEERWDRFEAKQDAIYVNQLLLCVESDLECERYTPR